MNAVEIEEAVSDLAQQPFDANEFPFAFLAAFGNKEATIKRLRSGNTNKSDVSGILQRNNIHIAVAVAEVGQTVETLARLKASPLTDRQKAQFILATDGAQVEAEEIGSGEVLSCRYDEFGNNFGSFLPLAGISTLAEVKNNPIYIKATSRLNRLYVQLLKDNADWGSADKRADLNRFMARMIFCFFAEDTGIFQGDDLFTTTVQTMTEADGSNTAAAFVALPQAAVGLLLAGARGATWRSDETFRCQIGYSFPSSIVRIASARVSTASRSGFGSPFISFASFA
ncbi:hypothetical protein GI582_25125 [Sulfitobacter sp. BDSS02]|nr:hypothetical protein [Sulfitobacter sp. BDSS02]MBR9852604.1 hypothetical protein [Paracoccaceae bacterium]